MRESIQPLDAMQSPESSAPPPSGKVAARGTPKPKSCVAPTIPAEIIAQVSTVGYGSFRQLTCIISVHWRPSPSKTVPTPFSIPPLRFPIVPTFVFSPSADTFGGFPRDFCTCDNLNSTSRGDKLFGLRNTYLGMRVVSARLAPSESNASSVTPKFDSISSDLQCSGCTFFTKNLRTWVHRRSRSWRKMGNKKREKWVRKSLQKACSKIPEQVCTYKSKGKTEYADFGELMKKGGSHSGLSMSGDIKKELQTVCTELASEYASEIEEGYLSVKRPDKYNVHKDVCVEITGACGAKRKMIAASMATADEDVEDISADLGDLLAKEDL
eukprot:jgi/Bigna1/133366/aug1.21_g8074